jgi:alpha-L-fucosidase
VKIFKTMNNTRRDFIKKAGLLAAAAPLGARLAMGGTISERKIQSQPQPSDAQRAWMSLGFGMFIHFGINTYYDMEWSDGTLDPSAFNPTDLDTDQWCYVAKKAGMKYIVLVAKHHDGFCLWPSAYTDYSVKSSPFKGDVVKELYHSAQKYGLKPGLYYSLWDRHEPSHDADEDAYVGFMKNQLDELLGNYGEIVELWFDGFWRKQQSGWRNEDGDWALPDDFIKAWRFEGAYRWQMDHLYQYVKKLQPNCLVMNNATTTYPGVPLHPVDALSGEKATEVKEIQRVWNWLGRDHYFPMQIETTMSQKGPEGQFETGSWFWHEWDNTVATHEQIREWLVIALKMDANLLLNCGPGPDGKLRDLDVKVLTTLL